MMYGQFGAMTPTGRWLPYGLNATEGMGSFGMGSLGAAPEPQPGTEEITPAVAEQSIIDLNQWIAKRVPLKRKWLGKLDEYKKMEEARIALRSTYTRLGDRLVWTDLDKARSAWANWQTARKALMNKIEMRKLMPYLVGGGVVLAVFFGSSMALSFKRAAAERRGYAR